MIKRYLPPVFLLIFCLIPSISKAEEQYISTYYPSPQGNYQTIRFYPSTQPAQPKAGYIYYDDDFEYLRYYNGSEWVNLTGGGSGGSDNWALNVTTKTIYNTNPGNVGIGTKDPQAKLEITGIDDATRLVIRGVPPFYTNPGLRLRCANGTTLGFIATNSSDTLGLSASDFIRDSESTHLGYYAGTGIQDGTQNTCAGRGSVLNTIPEANFNTVLAPNGLNSMTSFSGSTVAGYSAYFSSGNPFNATALGNRIDTGWNSTALGYSLDNGGHNSVYLGLKYLGRDGELNIIGYASYSTNSPAVFIYGEFGSDDPATKKLGIWTTSPQYTLDVNGTIAYNGAASCPSDKRWKKDIALYGQEAKRIGRVRPVSFEWKSPRDKSAEGKHFGFIAQELKKVFPEAVAKDSVIYGTLSYILLERVKQLIHEQNQLEAELTALEHGQN